MKGNRHRARLRVFFHDQRGATAVEYGLILALVFLAVMGGVAALGDSVRGRWGDIADRVSTI
jgi:pilus assembly protein Flp/PilA